VVIAEIFADPSPSAGLPPGEFIELRNNLSFPVTLDRWIISDGQSAAVIPAGTVLQPDSLLVLCARAYESAYAAFGQAIGLSGFPSLDNGGDLISLAAADGQLMHAVHYETSWYGNALKAEGGWSLEMIDHRFPCLGPSNWTASRDPGGGSPGRPNSVQGNVQDREPPRLLRTYMRDSVTLMAVLDETVDSLTASDPSLYDIGPGLGQPLKALPVAPLFREVAVVLPKPLKEGVLYHLQVRGLADCHQNTMPSTQEARAARPSLPGMESVCINEILFDPLPGGSDYVELYHKGNAPVDISGLFIGSRNTAGQTASLTPCANVPWILFPGDYLVLTEDPENILQQYPVSNPSQLMRVKDLPSFPDDAGTVLVTNRQGLILDEFQYRDEFHFALLARKDGVALERIDPTRPAGERSNWHSAATDARYGTPTGRNSQFREPGDLPGEVSVHPGTFSPDLDGFDDHLSVKYSFPAAGYVCSVLILDQAARPVRHLVRNQLCGITGLFRWDGLDEKNRRLPAGIYYVLVECFNLDGKRKIARKTVVLAYRK
jgi:hypothetical protein